jgi:hypothetical protein
VGLFRYGEIAVPSAERVIVFVDYQNLYATARKVFCHDGDPPQQGHVWPVGLGELLAKRRGRPSVLREVRVYRGLPDPTKQAQPHAPRTPTRSARLLRGYSRTYDR